MSRHVKIATISLERPPEPDTIQSNVQRAMNALDEVGKENPDIICLPEMYPVYGCSDYTGALETAADRAEDIVGAVADRARRWNTHIISDTVERDGDALYNTATLFDRHGNRVGAYRKTHLAPGEELNFEAGDKYPVFELDFGRVGIMICMDIHYPEIARIYALQGADILFWPTMSYGPTGEFLEVLFRSRAMDNQIYCASSNYIQQPYLAGKVMGRAYIVGPDGKIRADTGHRAGAAITAVDLDEGYEYWAVRPDLPTLKDAFLAWRRPETYSLLVQPEGDPPPWKISNPTVSETFKKTLTERMAKENGKGN